MYVIYIFNLKLSEETRPQLISPSFFIHSFSKLFLFLFSCEIHCVFLFFIPSSLQLCINFTLAHPSLSLYIYIYIYISTHFFSIYFTVVPIQSQYISYVRIKSKEQKKKKYKLLLNRTFAPKKSLE